MRSSLNVSLTPKLQRFVNKRVASGRYQSASEVVRDGLRLLDEREQAHKLALRQLRNQISVGLNQAKHGELRNGEVVFDRLAERIKIRRQMRK